MPTEAGGEKVGQIKGQVSQIKKTNRCSTSEEQLVQVRPVMDR